MKKAKISQVCKISIHATFDMMYSQRLTLLHAGNCVFKERFVSVSGSLNIGLPCRPIGEGLSLAPNNKVRGRAEQATHRATLQLLSNTLIASLLR